MTMGQEDPIVFWLLLCKCQESHFAFPVVRGECWSLLCPANGKISNRTLIASSKAYRLYQKPSQESPIMVLRAGRVFFRPHRELRSTVVPLTSVVENLEYGTSLTSSSHDASTTNCCRSSCFFESPRSRKFLQRTTPRQKPELTQRPLPPKKRKLRSGSKIGLFFILCSSTKLLRLFLFA